MVTGFIDRLDEVVYYDLIVSFEEARPGVFEKVLATLPEIAAENPSYEPSLRLVAATVRALRYSFANTRIWIRKLRVCDHASDVLRETGNPAVMWGDEGLLHMIADRAGFDHHDKLPWKRSMRVLNALSHTPGPLIRGWTRAGNGRWVRIFRLPEDPK